MTHDTLPQSPIALPGEPGASATISGPQPDPESLGIRPDEVIRHGPCGLWWTGRDRNHCGSCHETISSLSGFDAHQPDGKCVPPGSVGLVARPQPWGVLWVWPGDTEALARRKAGVVKPKRADR